MGYGRPSLPSLPKGGGGRLPRLQDFANLCRTSAWTPAGPSASRLGTCSSASGPRARASLARDGAASRPRAAASRPRAASRGKCSPVTFARLQAVAQAFLGSGHSVAHGIAKDGTCPVRVPARRIVAGPSRSTPPSRCEIGSVRESPSLAFSARIVNSCRWRFTSAHCRLNSSPRRQPVSRAAITEPLQPDTPPGASAPRRAS